MGILSNRFIESLFNLLLYIYNLFLSRFVPETPDFKNVRKEMVKYSNRSATKLGHKSRNQSAKR